MDKCGVSRIQVGHIVFYSNMGWVHIFLMKKADASFTESDERKELSLEIPNRMIFCKSSKSAKFGNIPNLGHIYQIKPVKDFILFLLKMPSKMEVAC